MKSLALQPFDILSRQEIAATLDNLSRASVAVLGDFCLDVYPKRENEKIARMAQLTQSQRDGEDFRGPICSPCG